MKKIIGLLTRSPLKKISPIGNSRAVGFIALLFFAAVVTTALGAGPQIKKVGKGRNRTLTTVQVQLISMSSKTKWGNLWKDTSPTRLRFRWITLYTGVGYAIWQASDSPFPTSGKPRLIASGDAGKAPAKGKAQYFYIDFKKIVKNEKRRPLNYYVRVVTYAKEKAQLKKNLTTKKKGLTVKTSTTGKTTGRGTLQKESSRDKVMVKKTIGNPSSSAKVSIISSSSDTRFTFPGLHPELYNKMRIHIDLNSLKILGTGGDEDPYLLIAVIYADGTTIVPFFDWTTRNAIYFSPRPTVRIDSPTKTHENVPGGDPGDKLTIPASTGHFEKVIKPIGRRLAGQLGLSSKQEKGLREATQVAIVVIGFEEDAVPSTEVVNESREKFVKRLGEELNGIIPLRIPIKKGGAPKLPNLAGSVSDIKEKLREELTDFAKAEGLKEVLLRIGLAVHWYLSPGALNADDYIGHALALFSYQQIMDAGTKGIPFTMTLDQNCKCGKPWYIQRKRTESIYYKIKGRIRLILSKR